jgi:lipoprotein-anchoring transpeptidase ErfK/SrfK
LPQSFLRRLTEMGGRTVAGLTAAGTVLVISGCTVAGHDTDTIGGNNDTGGAVHAREVPYRLNVDDREKVSAGSVVKVITTNRNVQGTITDGTTGEPQHLTPSKRGLVSDPLNPSRTYTVTTTADGFDPTTTLVHTKKATRILTPDIIPKSGTYGVGRTITATWPITIPPTKRDSFAGSVAVTGAPGTWLWTDGATMVFKPDVFWPGHTTITTITSPVATAVTKNDTIWFPATKAKVSTRWNTGRALIVTINSKTHRGNVTIDGKKARSFPISTGKPGYLTRSGVKTITDMIRVQRMTNVGVTDDEVYDLQVPYAMRITATGEFLHGAPWNGRIGHANTSHGCTNLRVSDAKWLFKRATYGDPVVTVGTKRPMETWNGPGAIWNR